MAASSDDKIITSDDHELSAVQQERQPQSQQDAQTPMTRTSPSRRRVLSLISQALITPNHDLKILRQAIHETEIFLEYAKRGLGEEVRALNGTIPRILTFCGQVLGGEGEYKKHERLRLLKGMVEGLEVEIRKGRREVRRLEGRGKKRKGKGKGVEEGKDGGVVVDEGQVGAENGESEGEGPILTGEGAVKNDSAKGKDGFTARHSSQRSRKASARAQEKKNEVHKSVDLVTSEAEHSTRQASQRGRKSSAKGPEKKDDVSETHGVSEDPYPGELIVPEELVPAGSISCASSHTRVTRAPTVASSSSTSIVRSRRPTPTSRKASMVAPELGPEHAETSKSAGGRESGASKASGRDAAAAIPSSKRSSERSSRASDSRLEKVDEVEFAQPDFEKSKSAARLVDDGEVSPRAQSAASAKPVKEVLAPDEEAAASRSLQTSRASSRPTTAPFAASKHRTSGGSAPSQHNLVAEPAKSNSLQAEEEKKAHTMLFSHRRSRSSKVSSLKRPEEASIAAVRAASKASDHFQESQGAEVASISSHHSRTSKSSSLRAEVTSEAAEEGEGDKETTAPRHSQSSRTSGSEQSKDNSEAVVQIAMGDSAKSPEAQEEEAASIRSHHSRTSRSSSLRAEVSSEAVEAVMHPSRPPSKHSSKVSGPRTPQPEQKGEEESGKPPHSEPSERSFAKAWASAAAAQHPLAGSKPTEDMGNGKRRSSAASRDRKSSTRASNRSQNDGPSSRSTSGSGRTKNDESPQTSLTSPVSRSKSRRSSRSRHKSQRSSDVGSRRSKTASTHSSRSKHSDEVDGTKDDALQGYVKPNLPRKCHHSQSQASSRCPSIAWSCELVQDPQGQPRVDANHIHRRPDGCS